MFKLESLRASLIVTLALACPCMMSACGDERSLEYEAAAFAALQSIREARVAELTAYFQELQRLAATAQTDSLLVDLFATWSYSSSFQELPSNIEDRIDGHFVRQYGEFYDLLWVDTSGFVFHSISRESDYRTNLFIESPNTLLVKRLRQISEPAFVDFEHYRPSREPGAFHVTPVFADDKPQGWLVFQQAINRVNTILTDFSGMGRTGEVYLINITGLMLSQSRFAKGSTILMKKIETEAARAAATAESGNLLITDYRGVRVFSSFARLDILGTGWCIVAEIDEDEVLTDQFAANQGAYREPILSTLSRSRPTSDHQAEPVRSMIKVDVGEYGFARAGQQLGTRGVATCTAVAVTFPGRFAYLAHVAPTDEVYNPEPVRLFESSTEADLLARLLEHLQHFDIYPYELDSLRVVVVATHDASCWNIIERLIGSGIDISQIKLLYNCEAVYANVTVQSDAATVMVDWFAAEENQPVMQSSESIADLGSLVKRLSI